eukprot:m51a1_g1285 hypothetical protein (343) ;mRNA; r:148001-149884
MAVPKCSQTILCVSLNQDHSCFSVGTTHGFFVFSSDPLRERFHREWGMGVGIVEILMRCNILAMVGGGSVPKFPKNKVAIWDDFQNKCIAELEFTQPVRGVKIRREIIAVVLDTEVHVYLFNDLRSIASLYTLPNPQGLCVLNGGGSDIILGFPGNKVGGVHLEKVDVANSTTSNVAFAAHQTALRTMAITVDGSYVVTASAKGTLVRVFESATGQLVKEFRRGTKQADIHCVNVSSDNKFIVAASNKGTCHVFLLTELNRISNAPRSIVRFSTSQEKNIVFFGSSSNSVIVVSYDGKYSKYTFTVDDVQSVCRAEILDHDLFQGSEPTPAPGAPLSPPPEQ